MNWLATIALVCEGILLLWVGYEWGRFMEKKHQASREEAIRVAARRDGCEWSLDFWRKHMNKTEWDELYQGSFDTKESS